MTTALITPSMLESVGRLFLAALLGAVIGREREGRSPAGLRTHTLVSIGSALFTLMSIDMDWWDGAHHDASKIAAGIVTGIGFLGAGTILRSGPNIRGLTTAASLWAMAGIGMTVGAGYYPLAVVTTVLVYACLTLLRKAEHKMELSTGEKQLRILSGSMELVSKLPDMLAANGFELRESSAKVEKNQIELRLRVGVSKKTNYQSLLSSLLEAGVINYEWRDAN